jgi:hypothetical protein
MYVFEFERECEMLLSNFDGKFVSSPQTDIRLTA